MTVLQQRNEFLEEQNADQLKLLEMIENKNTAEA